MKVSMLFEVEDEHELLQFERWLEANNVGVKSVTILPNTDELYETDPVFRAIIKEEKRIRKSKFDYINKNK